MDSRSYLYYIVLTGIFLVPLVITPNLTQESFILPKMVLIAVMLGLALFALSIESAKTQLFHKIRLSFTLPAAAIILLAVISSIKATNTVATLIGNYGRYNGIITIIGLIVLALLTSQVKWNNRRLKIILSTIVLTASLVSVYGLFQFFGYDFIDWHSGFELNRSFSTFGNPSLLSVYLSFIFPLPLALWLTADSKKEQIFWIICAIVISLTILTSFTRGGWLAALVSLFVFIALGLKLKKISIKRTGFLVLILFSLITAIFFVTKSSKSNTTNLPARASSIVQYDQGSIASRFELWRPAARLISDHPFFGVGPDNFGFSYLKHESIASARQLNISDDAHSLPLQLASTLGLPAAIAFYLLIISAMIVFIKSAWFNAKSDGAILSVGIVGAFAGFLIASSVTVSVPPAQLLPWIFVGIAAQGASSYQFGYSIYYKIIYVFTIVCCLVAAATFILLGFRLFMADIEYRQAGYYFYIGDYQKSIDYFTKASEYNPLTNEYLQGLAKVYKAQRERYPNDSFYWRNEININSSAINNNPLFLINYWRLADAYMFAAQASGNKDYQRLAFENLKKALTLRPLSFTTHQRLGDYYLRTEQTADAISELRKAARINSNQSSVYVSLEQAYRKEGMTKAARAVNKKVLQLQK